MKKCVKSEKNYIEYLLLICLFEPTIFVKNIVLNSIFIILACCSFIYILFKVCKGKKINFITIELIIIRIIYIGMTIIHKGDLLKVGYQSIIFISLMLYAYDFNKNKRFNEFIRKIKNIFICYLIINLITYIIFPEGINSRMYFLGYRTRFTEYAIILILLSILNYNLKISSKRTMIFEIIIAILNIILPSITTAIIGLIFLFIVYYISIKIKNINYRTLFILGIVLTLLIIFFRIQDKFSYIIENILNKSVTLTNRTEIWDESYKYIFDKFFLIGHGYPIDGNYIYIYGTLWQAHNQILQTLYEIGVVGTILFYDIILKALKRIEISELIKKKKYFAWIGATYIAFSIMMITEIYSYYIPFYVLISIGLYFKDMLNYYKRCE